MPVEKVQHLPKVGGTKRRGSRPSILIVDDEKSVLSSLKRLLADEAFDVVTTNCPKEALRMFSEGGYSVVISDYQMPDISGAELLREVKRVDSKCIRIMLTGATEAESVPETIARNILCCDTFISKPWDDGLLVRTLRECMAKYEQSSTPETRQE